MKGHGRKEGVVAHDGHSASGRSSDDGMTCGCGGMVVDNCHNGSRSGLNAIML